jgi:sulfate transport system permease protein
MRTSRRAAGLATAGLFLVVFAYLFLLLFLPLGGIFLSAFSRGLDPYVGAISAPDALHALKLSAEAAAISLPLNLVFGVAAAWAVARHEFPGRQALITLIDVPLSISPVIGGLVFVCLYGRRGWLGPWLQERGIDIIYSTPGIIFATLFVTLPFVVRELLPLMQAQGHEEEEIALSLGAGGWRTLWMVTLPNIRWALLHGAVLAVARAIGEFGAASVVSGRIRGQTDTLPLHIEALFSGYDPVGASACATLLIGFGFFSLGAKALAARKLAGAPGRAQGGRF